VKTVRVLRVDFHPLFPTNWRSPPFCHKVFFCWAIPLLRPPRICLPFKCTTGSFGPPPIFLKGHFRRENVINPLTKIGPPFPSTPPFSPDEIMMAPPPPQPPPPSPQFRPPLNAVPPVSACFQPPEPYTNGPSELDFSPQPQTVTPPLPLCFFFFYPVPKDGPSVFCSSATKNADLQAFFFTIQISPMNLTTFLAIPQF